ncbi:MAG: lysophospholipase [Rhodocyclaceae bacterium]|nr:lysophospholipase [Rhodocyclaceae bacterium]
MESAFIDGLELLSVRPTSGSARPPLLFVHGAYAGAWCWSEHFLPYFAAQGWNAHALSLSGHGRSRGRERLDALSIADYVTDVAKVVGSLGEKPILIGHSMGGFVVQKYLETHEAPAAVLMCAVPPQGLAGPAVSMWLARPRLLVDLNRLLSGGRGAFETLREALFHEPLAPADLARYLRLSQPESHRAIWDMMLFSLPHTARVLAHLPCGREALFVMGAEYDQIIPPASVEMTARTYGVKATIISGLGHGLMLESGWQRAAQALADWLQRHDARVGGGQPAARGRDT